MLESPIIFYYNLETDKQQYNVIFTTLQEHNETSS